MREGIVNERIIQTRNYSECRTKKNDKFRDMGKAKILLLGVQKGEERGKGVVALFDGIRNENVSELIR